MAEEIAKIQPVGKPIEFRTQPIVTCATEYLDRWKPQITTKEITPIPGWEPPAEEERAEHFRLLAVGSMPEIAQRWWVLPLILVAVLAVVLLARRK